MKFEMSWGNIFKITKLKLKINNFKHKQICVNSTFFFFLAKVKKLLGVFVYKAEKTQLVVCKPSAHQTLGDTVENAIR